jgi:ABC-type multidrug transport system fused ATPase/permease subunit
MNPTQFNTKEIYKLAEKEFHESNKLWGEIATEYANSSVKLFDDTMKFVYQALTAMGLVAGFGFAGIQGVENICLFFLGELIMFGSMMFGFYRIKIIYTQNSNSVEKMAKDIRRVYEKKAIALGEMMKELREKGTLLEKSNIEKYEESNNEIIELFGIGKEHNVEKDQSSFITLMLILFIVGFIILLLSFFPQFSC